MERDPNEIAALADVRYDERNVGAAIASGSFVTDGMIVAPCSMRSLSAIANSLNDTLLTRAADVCLKERRRLVLLARETPLHAGHLRLMLECTNAGAVILPPRQPSTIDHRKSWISSTRPWVKRSINSGSDAGTVQALGGAGAKGLGTADILSARALRKGRLPAVSERTGLTFFLTLHPGAAPLGEGIGRILSKSPCPDYPSAIQPDAFHGDRSKSATSGAAQKAIARSISARRISRPARRPLHP